MSIIETIKDVLIVFVALILSIVISMYLTGAPTLGIVFLFLFFVARATIEKRQNKKFEK